MTFRDLWSRKELCDFTETIFVQCENPVITPKWVFVSASELAVVTREQRRYGTLSSRTTRLVLRAASREERCVWKTLIDQRARCTLQQAGLGALTA